MNNQDPGISGTQEPSPCLAIQVGAITEAAVMEAELVLIDRLLVVT